MRVAGGVVSALGHALPGTRSGRLLVLIYHRVHPQASVDFPARIDAARFGAQMALIRRHCHPVALADAVSALREGSLPPRAVAVTFDDGYADNAEVALPILLRHGVPATFFVASGFLDGGRMWNDSVAESIRRAPAGTLDLRDLQLGSHQLTSQVQRSRVANQIVASIKRLPQPERQARVDALCERIGVALPDDLMMTSAQVRNLAQAGMEVGAHTVSHPILRTLDDQTARQEIQGNRAALERIIGTAVRSFAYPNGKLGDDYTERDRDLVESLGFDYALSTQRGVATGESDRFQLPRFTPWDVSPERWLARLLLEYRRPVQHSLRRG
jgi:peptidoglycan/xylan/chitin deacetylase (PgdA/CDA1 family)